jgi:molybdenum cofactor guanylyltransferase
MSATSKNANPPTQRLQEVTGVILAGGKSTRYGGNKAFALIDGIALIERVIQVMSSVFSDLLLITNTPEEYTHLHLPMVQDLIKGLGPLGGIYTGLKSISGEAGFFVACDMPYLCAPLIRHIVRLQGDSDAVVPRLGWMVEPLHSLYALTCIDAIEALIRSGNCQILQFFQKVRVRYVDEEVLRTFDPQLRCLANVNRPEDLPQGGSKKSERPAG